MAHQIPCTGSCGVQYHLSGTAAALACGGRPARADRALAPPTRETAVPVAATRAVAARIAAVGWHDDSYDGNEDSPIVTKRITDDPPDDDNYLIAAATADDDGRLVFALLDVEEMPLDWDELEVPDFARVSDDNRHIYPADDASVEAVAKWLGEARTNDIAPLLRAHEYVI